MKHRRTRLKTGTENLIALMEATELEIYSVNNELGGYIQWRSPGKEF